jgi:hypothetical protein
MWLFGRKRALQGMSAVVQPAHRRSKGTNPLML